MLSRERSDAAVGIVAAYPAIADHGPAACGAGTPRTHGGSCGLRSDYTHSTVEDGAPQKNTHTSSHEGSHRRLRS